MLHAPAQHGIRKQAHRLPPAPHSRYSSANHPQESRREFTRKTIPEQHYIYVDREASFTAIAEAMASGFGAVFGFTQEKRISPLTMPSSIYMEMPSSDAMKFRAAVFVSAEDAAKAEGDVKSAAMAAGDVVMTTHVGPYASLNQSHKALWDHCDAEGLPKAMPVWEIYVDDPEKTPEGELRTEIYRSLSG
ncbi:MAG: GyrI-like domain-containing protein [Marinicaulis sp.]|nr:GyrI-like domain-containing protein [Marinicaulis sp.]